MSTAESEIIPTLPSLLLKMAIPGLFDCSFSDFSNKHHYNSYNKYMWTKCPSSIQLKERSLPIPVVWSSNPVISKNLYWTLTVNFIEKTKIKKKEAGNDPFLIVWWNRHSLTNQIFHTNYCFYWANSSLIKCLFFSKTHLLYLCFTFVRPASIKYSLKRKCLFEKNSHRNHSKGKHASYWR